MFKAHISGERIQSCNEHSNNTAVYTSVNLTKVNLQKLGYLCGLIHDAGKYSDEFNSYIEAASRGEKVVKGSVIHSFAGVRLVLERYHSFYNGKTNKGWSDLTAEIIATAVGSHHGLFDEYDEDGNAGLCHRMEKQPEYDKKAISNFVNECVTYDVLDGLFSDACEEVEAIAMKCYAAFADQSNFMFYLGSVQRMVNSALMDGDRRDTAEFMTGYRGEEHRVAEWKNAVENVESLIDSFPNKTDIDRARREMSDACAELAKAEGGIYRLDLPTGAGKTLTGLRYALKHAEIKGKDRVIFAVPLLSVLDQNADVIREAVGNDSIILEHHSNIVREDSDTEDSYKRDYLTETWDSPIIITTLVQLMNTFFKGKTSSVRRFHSLCNSVIVIDEVQSVPEKMVSLFNMMINFLADICRVTVVLCSATQPALENIEGHSLKISGGNMISADDMKNYLPYFKRNTVSYEGQCSLPETVSIVERNLCEYGSVLVICNTKKQAAELYSELEECNDNCFHLSTAMCMSHRKDVLRQVRQNLDNGEKVICVSTQLIEAGVDISFGSVVRYIAGIDNIAQAAGRCNRNGEKSPDSPVIIVSPENENLTYLKEIKRAQDSTRELIIEFDRNPDKFDNNLISSDAARYYYTRLFGKLNSIKGLTEYSVGGHTLYDLLSIDSEFCRDDGKKKFTMRQAFRTAGYEFEVFDTNQISVIVPYGEGITLIEKLLSEDARNDKMYLKSLLEKAKYYSVDVFSNQYQTLVKEGAVYFDKENLFLILSQEYYDSKLGIVYSLKKEEDEWSTLIL